MSLKGHISHYTIEKNTTGIVVALKGHYILIYPYGRFASKLYKTRGERNELRKTLKEAIKLSEELYVYQGYTSNPEGRIEELKQILDSVTK